MRRFLAASVAVVTLGGGVALAQPVPTTPAGPPPAPADETDDDGDATRVGWDAIDRPLSRALAYERRDVIAELLERPGSLSAASAIELAEDVSIPRPHAEVMVEAARAGADVRTLESLLRVGLPAGVVAPAEMRLSHATEAQLRSTLGLSEAQAREFMRYRASARRVHQHFREIEAIREARQRGAAEAAARTREFLRASTPEKVRRLARALGLSAPEAELEARRLERLSGREAAELRARLLEGSTGGARDPLASVRRSDGTIEWKKLLRDQSFRGANGITHFAFAMFLKELAIVLRTGDRERLEEFVDGLMSTDFFINYGLFSAGASAADVAYGRFVRRVTRKHFMSGVLRSNLVLAAGLAVPMVARGEFTLDTYLVDVAALGLSATAVKAAVEGAKGVYRLVRGGRGILSLGRWGGVVGWVYSAGEAAVVLLLADHLADRIDRFLDERALRKRIEDAQATLERLSRRLGAGQPVPEEEIERAIRELEDAYDDARRARTRGLEGRLTEFRSELDAASRSAHVNDTGLEGLRSALERNAALRANIERRYGSVDAYMAHLDRERNGPVEERLRREGERFDADWRRLLDEAYVGPADDDPAPAPGSRLALYDEETSLLLAAMDRTTDPEARRLIALAIERVRLGRAVDRAIYLAGSGSGGGAASDAAPVGASAGMTTTLGRELDASPAATTDDGSSPAAAPLSLGPDGLPGAVPPPMGPSVMTAAGPADDAAAPPEARALPAQTTLPPEQTTLPPEQTTPPEQRALPPEQTTPPEARTLPPEQRTLSPDEEEELRWVFEGVAPVETTAPVPAQQPAPRVDRPLGAPPPAAR